MKINKILHNFAPVISISLFLVAIFVMHHEIKIYHWREIHQALTNFPSYLLFGCIFIALLGYFVLSFYDYLALEYCGEKLPYRRILFASFLSHAMTNNIGHGWISGGSVRYRFYSSWGIEAFSIAKIIVFCTVTYALGLMTTMTLAYFIDPNISLFVKNLPNSSVKVIILLSVLSLTIWWLSVIFYRKSFSIKSFSLNFPKVSLAIKQSIAASTDLLLASLVLYIPLYYYTGMPFNEFLVIYLLAQLSGLVSQVPGGIGIFEGSFLFLASNNYASSNILVALIIYRAVYYFLPLLLAGIALLLYEFKLHRTIKYYKQLTLASQIAQSAIPQIFSLLLLLGGSILLFSSVTPELHTRMKLLEYFAPLPVIEFSHLFGSIVAVILLFLSQAIRQRIDSAYIATVCMMILGIIFSLFKGLDYEEALILIVMLLAFLPTRKQFYRKSALLQIDFSPQLLFLTAVVIIGSTSLGFFSYKHVEFSNELWWQFSLRGDASRFLRSLVAIGVIITGFSIYRLLTRVSYKIILPNSDEINQAKEIIKKSDETLNYLALTGDKYFLWSESKKSFLMFGITNKYWVVMGEPIGIAEEYEELTWKLRTIADRHNAKICFYHVTTKNISLYLDLGLSMIKLGEEARVDLPNFNLEGRKRQSLRHAFNKFERDNSVSFEIIPSSALENSIDEMEKISKLWVKAKHAKEKSFSLGSFNKEYLKHCNIAVIKQENKIIALANLWELENKEELSFDLMRYDPSCSNGVMEYLTVSIMLWGKNQGYKWFNLGVAPLSGLEKHQLAPLWNKIGNVIFNFGYEFYNFKGLYNYKNKFLPQWQTRYLAAPSGISMASALLSVTYLVSGGKKNKRLKKNSNKKPANI